MSGTQPAPGGRSSGQAAAVDRRAAERGSRRRCRAVAPGARATGHAPARRCARRCLALGARPDALDVDRADVVSDEDTGTSHPDDATVISDGPNWWSGPGDMTEVADAPFGEPTFVSPADDHEGPTQMKLPAVVSPPTPRPGSWERAPALSAKVSQPAVSQLRPPRSSRRTPAGGVPGLAQQGPSGAAGSDTKDRALSSVLASLLSPGDGTGTAQVALTPPTRLDVDRDGRDARDSRDSRDAA